MGLPQMGPTEWPEPRGVASRSKLGRFASNWLQSHRISCGHSGPKGSCEQDFILQYINYNLQEGREKLSGT